MNADIEQSLSGCLTKKLEPDFRDMRSGDHQCERNVTMKYEEGFNCHMSRIGQIGDHECILFFLLKKSR